MPGCSAFQYMAHPRLSDARDEIPRGIEASLPVLEILHDLLEMSFQVDDLGFLANRRGGYTTQVDPREPVDGRRYFDLKSLHSIGIVGLQSGR